MLPLVLVLLLSAVYSWPYVQRRYILWRLQDYVDKDLRRLPTAEKERVDRWLAKLLNQEPWEDHGIIIDPNGTNENWMLVAAFVDDILGTWPSNVRGSARRTCRH